MTNLTSWDKKYIDLAKFVSEWSKDTTKVGSVLVNDQNSVVSIGFNGIARGLKDLPERLQVPDKYRFIIHSELNCLLNASLNGAATRNCTMYISTYHCCHACASLLIQAGIKKIICPAPDLTNEKWKESFELAKELFEEAKVEFIYY